MKKILLSAVLIFGACVALSAKDEYFHDSGVLPQSAKTVITDNFQADVSVVKVDRTMGHVEDYEVVLTDGTEVKFDHDGNWEDVEVVGSASVPGSFIPAGVAEYVANRHPKLHIVGIERDRKGYDVQLSNGIELKFNKKAQFVKYDR